MQDKVGYMLGDVGSCLLFNFIGSYLLVFYTDVFGISAAAVGTLMVVSRVWDAINDPMMGVIVDKRKRSKDGKFRPYLKYMGIPLGIFTILTFLVIPNISHGMKLAYAYVTYIGFGMAYTAINIPYGSLASVMTNDPVQRTELSTWRNLSGIFAMIPLMILTPKLVFDGSGAVSAKGFVIAAVLYAIIANIGFRLCYNMTTERIVNEVKEDGKVQDFLASASQKVEDTFTAISENETINKVKDNVSSTFEAIKNDEKIKNGGFYYFMLSINRYVNCIDIWAGGFL